ATAYRDADDAFRRGSLDLPLHEWHFPQPGRATGAGRGDGGVEVGDAGARLEDLAVAGRYGVDGPYVGRYQPRQRLHGDLQRRLADSDLRPRLSKRRPTEYADGEGRDPVDARFAVPADEGLECDGRCRHV